MAEIIKLHHLLGLAAAIAAIDDGGTRQVLAEHAKNALESHALSRGQGNKPVYDQDNNERLKFDWPGWFVACRTRF